MARSSSPTPRKRKRRCKAKTKAGKRCRAAPLKDGEHCLAHATGKDEVSLGFGGAQVGSGPKRMPRPHELMRDRVEAELDAILAPYFDTLHNAVLFTKYEGDVVLSEHPDLGARRAAAEQLLDRVYGKPKQIVEDVSEAPPIAAIVTVDDRAVSDAARNFLASLLPKA